MYVCVYVCITKVRRAGPGSLPAHLHLHLHLHTGTLAHLVGGSRGARKARRWDASAGRAALAGCWGAPEDAAEVRI